MLKHVFKRIRSGNAAARRFLALSLAFLLAVSGLGAAGLSGAQAAEGGKGSVSVSKVDESGRPLAGATLQLLDSQGVVKASWVSDGKPYVVQGLPYGSYILHEKAAPAGYQAAADVPVVLAPAQANPVEQDGKVVINPGSTGYSKAISMNGTAAYCLDRHTYFDLENAGKKEDLSKLDSGAVPADLENSGNIVSNRDSIIRALIAGYPNDALGIGKKYNLSDKDFNRVTQDVIWKLANGVEPGTYDTDKVDYAVHQSPRYKVYYGELLKAATDTTLDISGYDATIYWSPGSQPVVGALYNAGARAEVTLVNEKLLTVEISLTKKWVDAQGNAVTNLEDQWATFQLYQDGAPYGGEIRLDNTTGWSHSFGNLPAGYQYEVKEVRSSGTGLDTKPVISYTEDTQPDQTSTRTEYRKGLEEVEPEIGGGPYIIHVETWNQRDGEHNIRVLTDPLSAESEPPTDLDNIPAAYWWNLADAGNGSYYLRSGKGSTIAYTAGGSNNELTAVLANQATGARFTHSQNADGSYSLRTPYKYLGVERTFIFYLTSDNGIGFKQDNGSVGVENKVRFYQVVEEAVTISETIPGHTETTGILYSFANMVTPEEPEKPTVEISKTAVAGSEELPGAKLVITKKGTEEVVAEHITTTETWKVQLAPGEYTLTEITAPEGYEIAESIDFTVDENGLVGADKVHMEDAPTPEEPKNPTVEISKTAVANTEELPGAKLVITKKGTEEVVVEHITTTETWKVQLEPGEYTLTEITAPDGYEIAESIDFTVDENGLVGADKVHMEDAPTPEEPKKPTVEISKTAVAGTEELPGAKLVITKKGTEEVVAEHITTTETWKVQLEPGEYTLTEITAPEGYEIAESIDFTVDENGLVGADKVHMEDAPTPEEPKNPTVEISKTAVAGTEELPGAKLVITKKGTEEVVAEHITTTETWKVQLEPGEYTLTEITAPEGYEIAESIDFTVDENGLVGADKVHMEDAPTPEEPELPEEPVDDEPEEPGDEEPEEPVDDEPEEPGVIPPVPGEEEEEVQPSSEGPSEEPSESTPESSEVENTSEPPSEPVENESETPSQPEEPTTEEPVDNESETPSQPEEPGTEETEEPETVPPVEEETTAPVENESAVPTEPSQTAPATTAVPGTTPPSRPDTGDHSHIGLYISLLGFAAVGSGLLLGQSKNRSKEE